MSNISVLRRCGWLAVILVLLVSTPAFSVFAAETPLARIVVLGDPHIPGRHLDKKEALIRTINTWDDVDLVVAVGDITEDRGAREEYDRAKAFFGILNKPFLPVPGNHDYIYSDDRNEMGHRIKGFPGDRRKRLALFRRTFRLPAAYWSRELAGYRLVFLAPDDEHTKLLAVISDAQMQWLQSELAAHRRQTTIIFFHAPLRGSLENYNSRVNTDAYVAQPAKALRKLLRDNPQVRLWVSGHTHTPATEPSFADNTMNTVDGVTNIHCPDLQRSHLWVNSLFLYPDRIVVKTFDAFYGRNFPSLERSFPVRASGSKP